MWRPRPLGILCEVPVGIRSEKLMSDVAELTWAARRGDAQARSKLFETLYAELHRLAKRELWKHGGGVTLSATTLLHEAYLDLSKADGAAFPDRAHFLGYAARAMRGLIIDYARRRQAQKRGGGFEFTALDTAASDNIAAQSGPGDELQAISEALEDLAQLDAPLAELVDLKFFCGLTFAEIAALRGVSTRTVQRDWEKARLLLHKDLREPLT